MSIPPGGTRDARDAPGVRPVDGVTVLHVDDDAQFAALVADALAAEGDSCGVSFEVVTAHHASDAAERLDAGGVDCVVSDYEMPETDGIELLEWVRTEYGDLPFVLLTGEGDESVASEAITAGVTDYLQKGAHDQQYALLANRIVNAVRQHRAEHDIVRGYRTLDEARQGVCLLDEDGRFQYVNREYARACGHEPADLTGVGLSEVFPAELAASLAAAVGRVVETGEPQECEYHLHTDAGTRYFTGTLSVLVGRDESSVLWVGDDVTDRKHRERDLELALEAAEMGVWELDLQTQTSPTRTRRHDRIFGYEEAVDDWGFDRFLQHVHPDDRDWVEAGFERALEAGEWGFECRIVRVDGAQRWIAACGEFYYNDAGEPVRALGLVQDVTEDREREEELRETNERLSEFVGVVSHDLRSPLSVAQGRLELARRECDSEHLDHAASAMRRSAELVDDLLSLARDGPAGREVVPVDLAATAEDCWALVETRNATLVVETERTIVADQGQLRRLLENLFQNAAEHGGADVTVTVGDHPDGFYVADDGTGVEAADGDRVFEPGHSTGERGVGYGLSIVRDIAEAHGWTVEVTEGTAGGARFEVTGVEVTS